MTTTRPLKSAEVQKGVKDVRKALKVCSDSYARIDALRAAEDAHFLTFDLAKMIRDGGTWDECKTEHD